jgi:hypothetical protein
MRRRTLLVVLAGLAVVVAAGAVVLWPPQSLNHRITVENYELLRTGMNRAEIEGILGPPGEYSTGPVVGEVGQWGQVRYMLYHRPASESVWIGDTAWITVEYDSSASAATVQGFSCVRVKQATTDALTLAVWRVKRQWHRWFP